MEKKYILCFFLVFSILVFAIFIHELSHAIVMEIFGGDAEIFVRWDSSSFSKAKGSFTDNEFKIILIAGSVGAVLFLFIIAKIGDNLKNQTITASAYVGIIREIMCWLFSSVNSDADQLIHLAGINRILMFIVLIICLIMIILLWISQTYKIYKEVNMI